MIAENVLVTFHNMDPNAEMMIAGMGITRFPTFAVFNSQNEEIATWFGFSTAQDFAATMNYLLADPITFEARETRFKRAPTVTDAVLLAKTMKIRLDPQAVYDYYSNAMKLDAEVARQADIPIKRVHTVLGDLGGVFTWPDVDAVIFALLQDPQMKQKDAIEVGNRLFWVAKTYGIMSVIQLVEEVRTAVDSSEDLEVAANRARFLVNYALKVDQDLTKAVKLKRETMPAGWQTDPRALSKFAWWCFENKTNLDEAEDFAAQAAVLFEKASDKAAVLDTQAEIVFFQGHRDKAVTLMEQACALRPTDQHYQNQLEKFKGQ